MSVIGITCLFGGHWPVEMDRIDIFNQKTQCFFIFWKMVLKIGPSFHTPVMLYFHLNSRHISWTAANLDLLCLPKTVSWFYQLQNSISRTQNLECHLCRFSSFIPFILLATNHVRSYLPSIFVLFSCLVS